MDNLDTFSKYRMLWQHNTIAKVTGNIVNSIEGVDGNAARIENVNVKAERFVLAYGEAQVGKTSLILELIGIKTECQGKIAEILRAEIPRGSSSTSTAIIYQQSADDTKYGFIYTNGENIFSEKIAYYTESELKEVLKKLRKNVEANKQGTGIIHLYIPRQYFFDWARKHENICIMDMPGIGSRNEDEQKYVKLLVQKYMAVASVSIIVCRANKFQESMENLSLPNGDPWQHMPSKYIVCLTHALSVESTRNNIYLWCQEGVGVSELEKRIKENYVKQMHTTDGKKLLDEKLQIYPIEVGDSYEKLIERMTDSDTRNKLNKVKEYFSEELRTDIQQRKGNELKTLLESLQQAQVAVYEQLIEEKKEHLKDLGDLIQETGENIEKYNKRISGLDQEIKECEDNINHLRRVSEEVAGSQKKLVDNIKREIEDIFEFSEKVKLRVLKNQYESGFPEILYDSINKLEPTEQDGIEMEVFKRSAQEELRSWFDDLERKFDEVINYKDGWFPRLVDNILNPRDINDVKLEIKNLIKNEIDKLANSFSEIVRDVFSVNEVEGVKQSRVKLKEEMQVTLRKYKAEKAENVIEKGEVERSLKKCEDQKKSAEKSYEFFLEYACESFEQEKNEIIQTINSSNTSAEEKIRWLFVLLLMEQDYKKVEVLR